MLVVLRDGGSGVDVGERGHQLTRVIENSAAKLVFRPGGDGPVALRQIAKAGEGLVAVTARVEEVSTNYQEGDTMELPKETRDRIYAAADALAAA